jgi:hypothetical protein
MENVLLEMPEGLLLFSCTRAAKVRSALSYAEIPGSPSEETEPLGLCV